MRLRLRLLLIRRKSLPNRLELLPKLRPIKSSQRLESRKILMRLLQFLNAHPNSRRKLPMPPLPLRRLKARLKLLPLRRLKLQSRLNTKLSKLRLRLRPRRLRRKLMPPLLMLMLLLVKRDSNLRLPRPRKLLLQSPPFQCLPMSNGLPTLLEISSSFLKRKRTVRRIKIGRAHV